MSDADTIEEAAPRGPSRRTLLKGAAVGAGALWVAPTVATLTATPAAASPAGCPSCTAANLVNGTDLTGWTSVVNVRNTAFFTAGPTGDTRGSAEYIVNFDSTCQARLNQSSQPQATATVSGTLTTGTAADPTTVTVTFYPTTGATGAPSGTTTLSTTGSASGSIPLGTKSMKVTLGLGKTNNPGNQGGSVTSLNVHLTC